MASAKLLRPHPTDYPVIGLGAYALPLGVIGRTVEIKRDKQRTVADLACLSELTQHQLSVAVLASGAGKEAFYAGLFHDVYKPAMKWKLNRRWSWRHLPAPDNIPIRRLPSEAKSRFKAILASLDADLDTDKVAEICAGHHHVEENPIRKIEPEGDEVGALAGAVSVEVRIPLPKELKRIAINVASLSLKSPYRAFVASLFIRRLLNRLNESYAQFFQEEFGLQELHIKYVFRQFEPFSEDPDVRYEDGALHVEIPVRSPPSLEGLVIEHHYLPTLKRPSLSVSGRHVELNLRFSDALAFPIIEGEKITLWALAPVETLGRGRELKAKLAAAFEEAKEKALEDILSLSGVRSELTASMRELLPEELSEYKPAGPGEPKCMFCGARASFRVAKSLERFVDVDRIVAFNIIACAPCKLAYDIENARRASVPLCITPLPATPGAVELLDEFEALIQDFRTRGMSILTHQLPPVKTALEEPWARILSWIFYHAVLKDPDELGLTRLRSLKDFDFAFFRFFLTRRIMLYPFIFTIRPAAMISAWTTTGKKKFVLNLDVASEFVVLPGAERDLTLEDLDVLTPLAEKGKNSLRKAYTLMKSLYELG